MENIKKGKAPGLFYKKPHGGVKWEGFYLIYDKNDI